MHPYLPILLEDIKLAYREKIQASAKAQKSTEELKTELSFEEIERYVSGDDEQTFSYYCGLGSEIFPPADQFNDPEKEQVCTALESMFSSWNLEVSLPDDVPLGFRYELMVRVFDSPFTPFTTGFLVKDFCTGNPEGCDLGKYCPCLEFGDEV